MTQVADLQQTMANATDSDLADRKITVTTTPLRFRLLLGVLIAALDDADRNLANELRATLSDLMGRPQILEDSLDK